MKQLLKEKQDALKKLAAEKALEFIPHNEYIGIGTGSTVAFFIEALANSDIKVKGAVSTSDKTSALMAQYGIPEVTLNEVAHLPVYVDGADEINHSLHMIKGGGGALLYEKIVAAASDVFVCIADESKYKSRLGHYPLPVEVLPPARSFVARQLVKLGGMPELRTDFKTSSGNYILDVHDFFIDKPVTMEDEINRIPGVMDNGIFAHHRAHILVLATENGVEVLR